MCLLQSPQATLHHVSLFPLNSAYSDLWRTLWANALLLGAQNLWTIAVMKNLRSVTSQDLTEKPVGFLIGDARTVSPKYVYLQLQCPQRTTRGNATTFVIFFQPWNSPAFDHWSLHRPCCCCMSSQLGCWELESLFCGITVYWQCCSPRDWIESSKNKLASYPSIQWQQCSPCKGTTTPLDEVVWLFESKGQFPAGCLLISTTSSTDINAILKQIFCESKRIEKIINRNMMVFAYQGLSEIVDNMVSYQ